MSVSDGQLRIVATLAGGELGPSESQPVFVHWRWYYHVPALPLWGVIVLLLVVPKANRNRQAWLILLPLGLLLLVWRMPLTLLSAPVSFTEGFGFFVATGAMAWSVVWLLGHWFSAGRRAVAFFLMVAVMLAFGLLSYFCHFGDLKDSLPTMVAYSAFAASLLLAVMLTGYRCRTIYSPRRFLGWLLLWIGVLMLGLMFVAAAITAAMALARGARVPVLLLLVVTAVSLLYVAILYLLNLPFLILAFKSPFYRERFERIFRVATAAESADGNPFRRSPSEIEEMRP